MMGRTADAWPGRQRRTPRDATTDGIALVATASRSEEARSLLRQACDAAAPLAVVSTLMGRRTAGDVRWPSLWSAIVQHRGRIDVHGPAVRVGGVQLWERKTAFINEN